MKAHLMYRDRDPDSAMAPPGAEALIQDLALDRLLAAMAGDDAWLVDPLRQALLAGCPDIDTILYRQDILRDCLAHEAAVRAMYAVATETLDARRRSYFGSLMRYPGSILHWSIEILEIFTEQLRRLRAIAERHDATCRSEGFRTLFGMLRRELDDAYFATIRGHLAALKFRRGVLVSAGLGIGNRGEEYVLRKAVPPEGGWLTRLLAPAPPSYAFDLHPRDEAGGRALSALRDRGINLVANALAQSADHILSFFALLRVELAFYVGCLNLHHRLTASGHPLCFPCPAAPEERRQTASGLYDACLALTTDQPVVGNDLRADGKSLVIITGANQGGKSTFLRAVGLAHLMMQCGMFVPADSFHASLCPRVLTHFKREEDARLKSGRFDEELGRMSGIVDVLCPGALTLFNESFASTNEREGSEIARQIVSALIDRQVRVFFVTHQYALAQAFQAPSRPDVLFLRAERQDDGSRSFRLPEGAPQPTSYGEDLFREIFLPDAAHAQHVGRIAC